MTSRHALAPALTLALALCLAAPAARAQGHGPANHPDPTKNPYGPYAFLAGTWNVEPEDGGAAIGVTRFKWGPNRSYLWFSMAMLVNGKETPHFEGLLVWNGMKKKLDMLLTLDLANGLTQEQGTLSVLEDGTVVRDITMVSGAPGAGAGSSSHFRQTFRSAGPDRVLTNAMRETEKGWVATFPGSDHLAMTRRADS